MFDGGCGCAAGAPLVATAPQLATSVRGTSGFGAAAAYDAGRVGTLPTGHRVDLGCSGLTALRSNVNLGNSQPTLHQLERHACVGSQRPTSATNTADSSIAVHRSFQEPDLPAPLPRLSGPGSEQCGGPPRSADRTGCGHVAAAIAPSGSMGYASSAGCPSRSVTSAPPQQSRDELRRVTTTGNGGGTSSNSLHQSLEQHGALQSTAWWRSQEHVASVAPSRQRSVSPRSEAPARVLGHEGHADLSAQAVVRQVSQSRLSDVTSEAVGRSTLHASPSHFGPSVQVSQQDGVNAQALHLSRRQPFLQHSVPQGSAAMLPADCGVPWPPPPLPPVSTELRQRLEALEVQRSAQAVVERERELRIEELMSELVATQAAASRTATLEAEFKICRLEQEALRAERLEDSEFLRKQRSECDLLRGERDHLQLEVRRLRSETEQQQRAREETEGKYKTSLLERDKVDAELERLHQAEREQRVVSDEVETLRRDFGKLEADLSQERRLRAEVEKRHKDSLREVEALREDLRDLLRSNPPNECDELRKALETSKGKIAALERDLQIQKEAGRREKEAILLESENVLKEARRNNDLVINSESRIADLLKELDSVTSERDAKAEEVFRLREEAILHRKAVEDLTSTGFSTLSGRLLPSDEAVSVSTSPLIEEAFNSRRSFDGKVTVDLLQGDSPTARSPKTSPYVGEV